MAVGGPGLDETAPQAELAGAKFFRLIRTEMEFVPTIPVSVPVAREISNLRGRLPAWLPASAVRFCFIAGAGLACFLIALWPAATVVALGAGVTVRWVGHHLRWKAAIDGDAGQGMAHFGLINGAVECTFHEDLINRYAGSQRWRVGGALAAGTVCMAAQHLRWAPWNLRGITQIPHWLARTAYLCSPLLPLALIALFLLLREPEAHWPEKLKAAIRSRATDAVTAIMRPGEIDGLEAGVAGLYRQLDLWWAGEYRAAIHRWLESHTAQAIFEPESAAAFMKSVTEQARTDLNHLAEAAELFRSLECHRYALEQLRRVTGEPWPEPTQRAGRSADDLRNLAIARRWEQFRDCAAQVIGELDEAIMEFRLRSPSVVTLPAGTDPYRVLGIEASAPTATIRKLRLRLAQVYHPDIGGETSNDTKMAEVNAAYDAVMRERAGLAK